MWGGVSHPVSGAGSPGLEVVSGTTKQLCDQGPACGNGTAQPFFSLPYYDRTTGTTVVLVAHTGVEILPADLGPPLAENALPASCPAENIFPGPGSLVELPCYGAANSSLIVMDAATAAFLGTIPLAGGLGMNYFAWDGSTARLFVATTTAPSRALAAPSYLLTINVSTRSVTATAPLDVSYATATPLAFDPGTGMVLAWDSLNSSLRAIDPATGAWTTFAPMTGSQPTLSVDPIDGMIYASEPASATSPSSLVGIDLRTGGVDSEFPNSGELGGQIDPIRNIEYFLGYSSITAIDASTGQLISTTPIAGTALSQFVGRGGWTLVPGADTVIMGEPAYTGLVSLAAAELQPVLVPGTAFSAVPLVGAALPIVVAVVFGAAGLVVMLTLGRREVAALARHRKLERQAEIERLLS